MGSCPSSRHVRAGDAAWGAGGGGISFPCNTAVHTYTRSKAPSLPNISWIPGAVLELCSSAEGDTGRNWGVIKSSCGAELRIVGNYP